jgi:SAM-dependent methyltransferase
VARDDNFFREARDFISREAVALLPLFETFANEARFAREWLATSLKELPRGASILEVGAGSMLLSCQLVREGFRVTAVEPVGEGFEEFRQLQALVLRAAACSGETPTVITEPVERMPELAPFDFAFSVNVMEHVPSVPAALRSVFSVLRPGASYRFTCPNYLFPYEPHFNIPILFSKALTGHLMHSRIAAHTASSDPAGLWRSLNWISVPAVARVCRTLPKAKVTFDTGMLANALSRVVDDAQFAARRPTWLIALARLLVASRAHRLFALLPASLQPLMDCRVQHISVMQDLPRAKL